MRPKLNLKSKSQMSLSHKHKGSKILAKIKIYTLTRADLFLFVFWKKLKTPKRPFEINWPLVSLKKKIDFMKNKLTQKETVCSSSLTRYSKHYVLFIFKIQNWFSIEFGVSNLKTSTRICKGLWNKKFSDISDNCTYEWL